MLINEEKEEAAVFQSLKLFLHSAVSVAQKTAVETMSNLSYNDITYNEPSQLR